MGTALSASARRKVGHLVVRPYGIIDTIHKKRFRGLVRLAAMVCQAPIALISISHKGRHRVVSHVGLSPGLIDRDFEFCEHIMRQKDLLMIPDLAADFRFVADWLGPTELEARFLAAVPLLNLDGQPLGTLCVLDRQPRQLDEGQMEALRTLGQEAVAQLELRHSLSRLTRASAQGLYAEHALAAARDLLRTVIDSVPDNICLKDAEGRYILNNAAHLRFIGARSTSEAVGKTVFDFFPKQLASKYDKDDRTVLRLGEALLNFEEPKVDAAGMPGVLSTSKIPIRDHKGDLTGLLCVSRDITTRKPAEEAMARLAAIVNYSSDAIFSMSLDGAILTWNAAATRLYGYRAKEHRWQTYLTAGAARTRR